MSHSISNGTEKTKLKIVFLGGQGAGKSSIIQKYMHNNFYGTHKFTKIDFLTKNITHRGKQYRLQLWDTAGGQRFRSLITSYLKDAHHAFIVFDVTQIKSFQEIEIWINIFNQNKTEEGLTFLVGNKTDLQYRQIKKEDAAQKAAKLNIPYIQTSAKTGENIQKMFQQLIDCINHKNFNAHILQSSEQKEVIKEERKQDEQLRNLLDQTVTKLECIKEKVEVLENVVLKNKKITGRTDKQKGCC